MKREVLDCTPKKQQNVHVPEYFGFAGLTTLVTSRGKRNASLGATWRVEPGPKMFVQKLFIVDCVEKQLSLVDGCESFFSNE
jgi:hypothetical protein